MELLKVGLPVLTGFLFSKFHENYDFIKGRNCPMASVQSFPHKGNCGIFIKERADSRVKIERSKLSEERLFPVTRELKERERGKENGDAEETMISKEFYPIRLNHFFSRCYISPFFNRLRIIHRDISFFPICRDVSKFGSARAHNVQISS